nr:MAG TPA: hypothetical protein [Caudoviricetes sp.]DAX57066.1 MAG TPA: hypothetical protein [Crassvirales sp.]
MLLSYNIKCMITLDFINIYCIVYRKHYSLNKL